MATSIATYPIEKLDFPTVTVCPPRGSNTALNHDLIKADNQSLTEKDREHLKEALYEIFMEPSHQAYMAQMLAFANRNNIRKTVDGFHAVPKPFGPNSFEIIMWNSNGTFQTPGFGERLDKDYYKVSHLHHVVIEFPENLLELVGDGTLVIEIEVKTKEGEGLSDVVQYSDEQRYEIIELDYTEMLYWYDSKRSCQGKKGHLASILSEWELNQLEKMLGTSAGQQFWLSITYFGSKSGSFNSCSCMLNMNSDQSNIVVSFMITILLLEK